MKSPSRVYIKELRLGAFVRSKESFKKLQNGRDKDFARRSWIGVGLGFDCRWNRLETFWYKYVAYYVVGILKIVDYCNLVCTN